LSLDDDNEDEDGTSMTSDYTFSVPLKRSASAVSISSQAPPKKKGKEKSVYKSEVASAINDLSMSIGAIRGEDYIQKAIDIVQEWKELETLSEEELDLSTIIFENDIKAKIFCRLSKQDDRRRFLEREIKALTK
jgi:hypothetical protein